MADRFSAKWPVPELSDDGKYLAAKYVAGLYDVKYSTFMDLPPNLRQPVKTRFSANGELSHGYFA
jgi:hypothetical protein